MRSLVYTRVWLGIGIALVVFVVALTLWPVPLDGIPKSLTDKTGHVLAYFVLMLWFAGLWPRRAHLRWAVFFVVMGIGLEWLQGFVQIRVTELLDAAANALGALIGLALAWLGLDRWSVWLERLTPRGRATHG